MDIRIALVVAQQDVVTGFELLDQRAFQNQRLGLGMGNRDFDGLDVGNQAARPGGRVILPKVAGNPLPEIAGFSDIQHLAVFVQHPVDARQRGEGLEKGLGVQRERIHQLKNSVNSRPRRHQFPV